MYEEFAIQNSKLDLNMVLNSYSDANYYRLIIFNLSFYEKAQGLVRNFRKDKANLPGR